jgi:hypothetical protein
MSFTEMLREASAKAQAQAADPWRLPLERVRGKVGDQEGYRGQVRGYAREAKTSAR